MAFSDMQQAYLLNATHRWNIKTGATGSGKTWLDCCVVIPKRILNCTGSGLIVLIGNTRSTIERNVLTPMRSIWGKQLVGSLRINASSVEIFGRQCIVMGADKANQVERIQGATIEYCYGDEITTWSEPVFQMLKSRLRTQTSVFDGTCNPESPSHWFKAFLDSDADIYQQAYTIHDNPFLPANVVRELKKEYAGTVYYDRYILGLWRQAEGAVYRIFADNPAAYLVQLAPNAQGQILSKPYDYIQIGLDFGGNQSAHTLVASGLTYNYSRLTALASRRLPAKDVTPTLLFDWVAEFVQFVQGKYGRVERIYADNVEQTLIAGLRQRMQAVPVINSLKHPIIDRIRCTTGLMALGKFGYTADCQTLKAALIDAVYDTKASKDERLDNGTSDIDTLDAFEYSFENRLRGYARHG